MVVAAVDRDVVVGEVGNGFDRGVAPCSSVGGVSAEFLLLLFMLVADTVVVVVVVMALVVACCSSVAFRDAWRTCCDCGTSGGVSVVWVSLLLSLFSFVDGGIAK